MNEQFQSPVQGQVDPKTDPGWTPEFGSSPELGFRCKPLVALVCPHEGYRSQLRRALEAEGAKLASGYDVYPGYAQIPSLLEAGCDAYLVEIDSDQDLALDVVET